MTIFDLYSKRKKRLLGDVPDVFTYDKIPHALKVQIVHIWKDSLGNENEYYNRKKVSSTYEAITETLCREYGVFQLQGKDYERRDYMSELINFFLNETDCDKAIDVIELSFRAMDNVSRSYNYRLTDSYNEIADEAINELNSRFKEHGIGYQYEEGEILRVDSQLLHQEVIKPTLKLLNSKYYTGAQQEFLNAYEHYRHNKHKEALNDALKSFENSGDSILNLNIK